MGNAVLDRLLEQRSEQESFIEQLLERVDADQRDLVDAERDNLKAARQRIEQLDEQIKPIEEFEQVRAAHRASTPRQPNNSNGGGAPAESRRLAITPREQKYATVGDYIVDHIRATGYPGENFTPDPDAVQRVRAARGYQARAEGDVAPGVHQTTDQTPGILPTPIVGEILNDLDASRPFVSSIGAKTMDGIPGKTFTRPKVTQHTKVGKQAAEKAELPARQLIIGSVGFTKETFGGWLNVSRQDIDWTSPTAWNAIVADLQAEYGVETDDAAADAFATAVKQTVPVAADADAIAWVAALYAAAGKAVTANGTKRASALRMPNHIWTSVDMWESIGAAITSHYLGNQNKAGAASPNAFSGTILDVPRTMVPGLPAGTVIVGRKNLVEFYEERIGLLQAIEPKVLGVEIAYGGFAAYGVLDDTGFVKITPTAAPAG